MDSDLGLSFFKFQIFARGGTSVQIFFKKLYFDLPIPKRGLPGPHCLPFWSYGAPKFCKIWANLTHSLWRTTFCKMKAVRNYVWENLRHSLWTTIFCKMKTVRNYVWENLRHSLWTTSFLQFWHLENFSRFSVTCAPITKLDHCSIGGLYGNHHGTRGQSQSRWAKHLEAFAIFAALLP